MTALLLLYYIHTLIIQNSHGIIAISRQTYYYTTAWRGGGVDMMIVLELTIHDVSRSPIALSHARVTT